MQYEGAVKKDGRGLTVWDKFAHSFGIYTFKNIFIQFRIQIYKCLESWLLSSIFVGKVADFSNADVAVDQYHRFEVNLPKSTHNVLHA
jgi:beta-glucosidase